MEKRFDMILGKQRARARLREFIAKHLHSRKSARVLCLPGEHGREIESVYRKLDFQDRNIVGLEIDPESCHGVREHYPRIVVVNSDVGDYVEDCVAKLREAGKVERDDQFDVVSLDFCGNYSDEKLYPLCRMSMSGLLADTFIVATNFFAGRETGEVQKDMRHNLFSRKAMDVRWTDRSVEKMSSVKSEAGEADLREARDVSSIEAVSDSIVLTAGQNWRHYMSPYANCQYDESKLPEPLRLIRAEQEAESGIEAMGFFRSTDAAVACRQELYELIIKTAASLRQDGTFRESEADAEDIAFSIASNAYLAWLLKHSPGFQLRAVERYSYINDKGHRMLSDYTCFRRITESQRRSLVEWTALADGVLIVDPRLRGMKPLDFISFCEDLSRKAHAVLQNDLEISEKLAPRIDLGGGALPIDEQKMKDKIVSLLRRGRTDEEIMAKYPVTVGSLRAYKAHLTRGTFA